MLLTWPYWNPRSTDLKSSPASRGSWRIRRKSGLSKFTVRVPDLIVIIPAQIPSSELALTVRSLNSHCSTRMSQSVWIFLPRNHFDQSMLGSAITSRVKHLFLLRVPWCFRASALSFARSTFADTTLENMDTFPMKAAFLDAGCSFIGEASLETAFGMMGESLGDVILPARDLMLVGARLPAGSILSSLSSYGEVTFSLDNLRLSVETLVAKFALEKNAILTDVTPSLCCWA